MAPTFVTLPKPQTLVGRPLGPSEPIVIDQNRVDSFAQTTGDRQWVHVDVARAEAELNGTLAHGYLILLVPDYVSQLLHVDGVVRALNYGLDRVRFLSPVRPPAMLAGSLRVTSVEARVSGVLMTNESFDSGEPGLSRQAGRKLDDRGLVDASLTGSHTPLAAQQARGGVGLFGRIKDGKSMGVR